VLRNPYAHLDDIFEFYVLQKEIHQGERAGWYTRLVDGILTPQRAVDLGVLDITGGEALDMTLSYYVLDDTVLEAYESGGYLKVPDGLNDNSIVDPIWLNKWKDATRPDDNSQGGGSGSRIGRGYGGGGCNGGAGAVVLFMMAVLAAAEVRKRAPWRRG
jgi:hypothetical protein